MTATTNRGSTLTPERITEVLDGLAHGQRIAWLTPTYTASADALNAIVWSGSCDTIVRIVRTAGRESLLDATGGRLYIISTHNPDTLRGHTFDRIYHTHTNNPRLTEQLAIHQAAGAQLTNVTPTPL